MEDSECHVKDPDRFTTSCSDVLKRVLNKKDVSFAEEDTGRGSVRFYSVGSGATPAAAGNRSYKVLPFYTSETAGRFWISIVLRFTLRQTDYILTDAGIILFKGTAQDNLKNPLVRAEWASPAHYGPANHAQPHWHAYPEGKASFYIERGFLGRAIEAEEFKPDSQEEPDRQPSKLPYFHLAMASKWHEAESPAHRFAMSSSRTVDWIAGCTEYLRNQVSHTYG